MLTLIATMIVFDGRRFLDALVAKRRADRDDRDRGQIHEGPGSVQGIADLGRLERRRRQIIRYEIDAVVLEQLDEIAAPADRNRRAGHHVFENQVPADEPGDELAQVA
jgi:hypothetical protein